MGNQWWRSTDDRAAEVVRSNPGIDLITAEGPVDSEKGGSLFYENCKPINLMDDRKWDVAFDSELSNELSKLYEEWKNRIEGDDLVKDLFENMETNKFHVWQFGEKKFIGKIKKNDLYCKDGTGYTYSKNGSEETLCGGNIISKKLHGKGFKLVLNLDRKWGQIEFGDFQSEKLEGNGVRITIEIDIDIDDINFIKIDETVGTFENGIMEGKGKRIWFPSGRTYIGDWVQGKMTGEGTMSYNNGEKYEGSFKDKEMCGFGKMKFKNGNIYEGYWLNNKQHGQGKTILGSGKIEEGTYFEGKLKEAS